MSGVLLLCILPQGADPGTEIARLAGCPVEGLAHRSLSLWIRPAPPPRPPGLAEIRAHHRIVEAAWQAHPAVLPVRFGQWFATRDELTLAMEPRVAGCGTALARVRGRGEFSIRILDRAAPAPDEAAAGSGTEYLRAAAERARRRAAAEARGRDVAGELRASLGELVREERVEALASPGGLATVAHLVDRGAERAYADAVDRFADERAGLRFLRTGPWPAWSFSE